MGHEKQVIAKDKQEVELLLLVLRFKNQKDNDASIVQPQSPFSKLESTDVGDRTTMVTRITLMAVVVTIRPAAPPRPQARAALALLRFDIPVRSDSDSVVRHCPNTRKDHHHHHQCGWCHRPATSSMLPRTHWPPSCPTCCRCPTRTVHRVMAIWIVKNFPPSRPHKKTASGIDPVRTIPPFPHSSKTVLRLLHQDHTCNDMGHCPPPRRVKLSVTMQDPCAAWTTGPCPS